LLVIIYHVLSTRKPYPELGADYFEQHDRTRLAQRSVRQLEALGYTVTVASQEVASRAELRRGIFVGIAQRGVACSAQAEHMPPLEGRRHLFPDKEGDMTSSAESAVRIQTSSESVPSTPCWLGEVVLLVEHVRTQGILALLTECVRCARKRCGHLEVIDSLAVLIGSAISGERTLEAFSERLAPCAEAVMAFFNRELLSSRSALRRFPAAAVEALRPLFLEDLLARPLSKERQRGERFDRTGRLWDVFDSDGTREAVRQRFLPKAGELLSAQRRLDEVCAAGSTGRTCGEAVRTRIVVSQAHRSPWLGICGNRGNGEERQERGARARGRLSLSGGQRPASSPCPAEVGWTLRRWGHHDGPGWTLCRDAGQR
jgi:hypothetical protein